MITPFDRCDKLEEIAFSGENNYYSTEDGVLFDTAKNLLITYPTGKKDTTYTIPDWITEWDMNNIDISAENFDGTKTVNLKSIAESLKSSVIADTQDKIFELDLVIDGRS